MVPTHQIIELKKGGCRNVKSVGLATLRQHVRRDIGDSECFHCLADRMNDVLDSLEVFSDLVCVFWGSLVDLGQDNVGNHALAANAIEKGKQPMHNLLPIARLTRGEASPDACFQIKRWSRH